MQTTFMTIQALQFAAHRSSQMIRLGSPIRVAALAQPESGRGSWQAMRGDWSTEPERAMEFVNKGQPAPRAH